MRKIQLNKTVEEFEVNGQVYKMDTKDEKMMGYVKESRKMQVELDKVEAKKIDDPDQVEEFMNEAKALVKKAIELFFGEGEFERLYKDCGESLYNVLLVIEGVQEFLNEYQVDQKTKQREKYKR